MSTIFKADGCRCNSSTISLITLVQKHYPHHNQHQDRLYFIICTNRHLINVTAISNRKKTKTIFSLHALYWNSNSSMKNLKFCVYPHSLPSPGPEKYRYEEKYIMCVSRQSDTLNLSWMESASRLGKVFTAESEGAQSLTSSSMLIYWWISFFKTHVTNPNSSTSLGPIRPYSHCSTRLRSTFPSLFLLEYMNLPNHHNSWWKSELASETQIKSTYICPLDLR